MKRKKILIIIISIILVVSGCKSNPPEYTTDYKIAVIETTGQENSSIISFYDSELVKTNFKNLPYGSMGNIFYNPVIYDNKLYTIPQGIASTKDLRMVLELDLSNGDIEEYNIDELAMNSIAVNEKYIYTCNTINGASYINRCDKENKSVIKSEFSDLYISKLAVNDNIIYAFGTKKGEESSLVSYLYVLDTSLNIIKKIDISNSGSSHYKTAFVNDELYFSNPVDREDQPNNLISHISTKDYTVENININNLYPSDIISYKDMLIIAHCNLVLNEGNLITFYNPQKKTMKVVELQHNILQMNLDGDFLYIIDQEKMYEYKIVNDNVELVNEESIQTAEKTGLYYYVSGFFVKE